MKLSKTQREAVLRAEDVILSRTSTEDEMEAAIQGLESIGLEASAGNLRHMAYEWRGVRLDPHTDKAVKYAPPPATISNPKTQS